MCGIGRRRRVEELQHLRPDPYPAVTVDEGLQVGGHPWQIVDGAFFLVRPVALVVFRPYLASKDNMVSTPFFASLFHFEIRMQQRVVVIISTVYN